MTDEKGMTTYLDEESRKAMGAIAPPRVIFASSPTDPNIAFQQILQDAHNNTKGAFA